MLNIACKDGICLTLLPTSVDTLTVHSPYVAKAVRYGSTRSILQGDAACNEKRLSSLTILTHNVLEYMSWMFSIVTWDTLQSRGGSIKVLLVTWDKWVLVPLFLWSISSEITAVIQTGNDLPPCIWVVTVPISPTYEFGLIPNALLGVWQNSLCDLRGWGL